MPVRGRGCGRGIGARAIGVATGHYSMDELWAHEPAAVFEDLSPTHDVVCAILEATVAAAPSLPGEKNTVVCDSGPG